MKPEQIQPQETVLNQPVDEAEFHIVWKEFAELRKNFLAEYHLLQQPVVFKDLIATLHLLNPVQEAILQNIQSELTDYLRKKLRNQSIQIKGELKLSDSNAIPYTNREKFTHMAKKNPLVNDLMKSLGLDPDF